MSAADLSRAATTDWMSWLVACGVFLVIHLLARPKSIFCIYFPIVSLFFLAAFAFFLSIAGSKFDVPRVISVGSDISWPWTTGVLVASVILSAVCLASFQFVTAMAHMMLFNCYAQAASLAGMRRVAVATARHKLTNGSTASNAAWAFLMCGDLDQAERVLKLLKRYLPDPAVIPTSEVVLLRLAAKVYLHLSLIDYLRGASPLTVLQPVERKYADLTQVAFAASFFHLRQGHTKAATELYRQACREHPQLATNIAAQIKQGVFPLWLLPTYGDHNAVLRLSRVFEGGRKTFEEHGRLTPADRDFFLTLS
jgi:hypothetical protein